MTWPLASSAGPALGSIQPPSSSSLAGRCGRAAVEDEHVPQEIDVLGVAGERAHPGRLLQTRLAASDWKATKRPSPEITGDVLSPPADYPSAARLTQLRASVSRS